jgi:integrase/recombinase XerD
MRGRDLSVNHQINNLKVAISYADFLGPNVSFHDILQKEQILAFLDSKKKVLEDDPEKRWITTWNYYLNRLKLFFRWLGVSTDEPNAQAETRVMYGIQNI